MKVTEKAQYPGSCFICGDRIYVGDVIVRSTIGTTEVAAHAACDPDVSVTASAPPEPASRKHGVRMTAEQQLSFLARDVLPVLRAVEAGYTYDPGSSDLDDEQPITVRMTLGDYRRASRLKHEVEKFA